MRFKPLFVSAAVLSSIAFAALPARHRTIYYGGKVFTADPRHPWAEALAVENELVLGVGSNPEVLRLADRDTRLVDLRGRALIPGFNDAHVHPYDSTSFPRAARLNQASDFVPGPGPTLRQVLDLVRDGAARNPPGTWLFASVGTAVVEDANANRFALDAVSPDHPVLLATWYGHGTYLNSAAMRTIGLREDEPDPFGGFYQRVPGSSSIDGVAHEYAEHSIRRWFAGQMTDAELRDLYESFAGAAARMGYTSVQEFSVGLPQARHLQILAESKLPIRWRAICFPLALDEDCHVPYRFTPARPYPALTASGIKWIADGTYVERLAFLTEDYADAPARGRLNFPRDAVRAELRRSITGQPVETQPLFHSVGDGTADTILDEMSALAPDGRWKERRPRIEHGTLLRPSRYESARHKGVFVVQNPLHFTLAPFAAARLPPALFADVDPLKTLLDVDVKLALGSDSVGAPGNPWLDLFFASTQPTRPSEAISVEEAVIAYTRTAAEAEFQEEWKGTLEPGKLADFIVLSQDIFTIAKDALPATRPVLTVVGGRTVYDTGILQATP